MSTLLSTVQRENFEFRKKTNILTSLILFIGIIIFSSHSFAQSLENESSIIEYLGEEKYNEYTQSNPAYLNFLDARYSYGYSVMDYVDEKMNEYPVLEIIYHSEYAILTSNGKEYTELVKTKVTPEEFLITIESNDFNFLEYQFAFDRNEVVYHVLGNTGKIIMINSVENINRIVNIEN